MIDSLVYWRSSDCTLEQNQIRKWCKKKKTKKKVGMIRQSLYILVPGLDVYALYKIRKLRLGLLITALLPLSFVGIMYLLIDRYPLRVISDFDLTGVYVMGNLIFVVAVLGFWVWLVRRWSGQWNRQFSESAKGSEDDVNDNVVDNNDKEKDT